MSISLTTLSVYASIEFFVVLFLVFGNFYFRGQAHLWKLKYNHKAPTASALMAFTNWHYTQYVKPALEALTSKVLHGGARPSTQAHELLKCVSFYFVLDEFYQRALAERILHESGTAEIKVSWQRLGSYRMAQVTWLGEEDRPQVSTCYMP